MESHQKVPTCAIACSVINWNCAARATFGNWPPIQTIRLNLWQSWDIKGSHLSWAHSVSEAGKNSSKTELVLQARAFSLEMRNQYLLVIARSPKPLSMLSPTTSATSWKVWCKSSKFSRSNSPLLETEASSSPYAISDGSCPAILRCRSSEFEFDGETARALCHAFRVRRKP